METPIYPYHKAHAKKIVRFYGWDMPLYYESIMTEHLAVRSGVGLFDVSHMGKLLIRPADVDSLDYLIPNSLPRKPGICRYTHLLNQAGRVIDDVIITCLEEGLYLCVCNAGATEAVVTWLRGWLGKPSVEDLTRSVTCLAVQGPLSTAVLQNLVVEDIHGLKPFRGMLVRCEQQVLERGRNPSLPVEMKGCPPLQRLFRLSDGGGGQHIYVTRTGYTGEDGFEIFAPNEVGKALWLSLLKSPQRQRVVPAGLGARDTLRLEKGYLLSGQDFDGRQTPLEVSYERLVRWDRRFLGRDPLLQLKERGEYRILKGILLKERGVPRPGSRVFWSSKSVGWLTSGTISPSLRAGIGLGYLDPEVAAEGNDVEVEVRDRRLRAEVVGTPFL